MNTLLLGAADVIERNGWIQNDFYEGYWTPDTPGPVCPRAAIAIAAGQHPLFTAYWPQFCERPAAPTGEEQAVHAAITAAEDTLARYIREELRYDDVLDRIDASLVESWADDPARTLPEVIGALRAAAEQTGRPA